MAYSNLNNGYGIRKERTEKLLIGKIRNKKESMAFCRIFGMFHYEWLFEVRILSGKQKKPSEKEIGDWGIGADFLRNHFVIVKY